MHPRSLEMMEELAAKEGGEDYKTFWESFGRNIKVGLRRIRWLGVAVHRRRRRQHGAWPRNTWPCSRLCKLPHITSFLTHLLARGRARLVASSADHSFDQV